MHRMLLSSQINRWLVQENIRAITRVNLHSSKRDIKHGLKLMISAVMLVLGVHANAADFTVVSAAAAQVPVTELAAQFERATGHHARFVFATGGEVDERLRASVDLQTKPDVVINDQVRLTKLIDSRVIASSPVRSLGTVQIGLAVRKGGQRPDISSVDGFKASLLQAQSIAYGDPSKGPTSGVHFAKVLAQLGLTEAIKPRQILAPNGIAVMRLVSSGEAELGITQISEILHIQADTLVGPLPEPLQLNTTYAVAFGTDKATVAAQQFVELLVSAEGRAQFISAGFR